MNDQNGFDSNGVYHFNYSSQPSDPWEQPRQTVPTPPQPPKKKRGGGTKAVALVLCCALAGGGAGVGGAALYNSIRGGSSTGETVIYRNDTNPTPVKVKESNGLSPMSLSEIYTAYVDSCVCITVEAMVQQGWYQYPASGAGSGFIISEDGYIVTNYHVIDGATSIKVTLNNGETYDAKLVGGEELNDVAVLKIDGVTGLKPVVLGDSDNLMVGETVCTIGNALGTLSFSQTSGAVSATGRSVSMSDGTVMNMIQTECTINSGNSGGPLFDSYGRVVGITSAKLSNNGDSSSATIEGIGFAIPLNDVIGMITDYMQYGYVTGRPSMGITVATLKDEYQEAFGWPAGVYVNSVEEGSCAERAGLKKGDTITKLGDTDVTSTQELTFAKNHFKAGDTAQLSVYRMGEELTLDITFDEQVNNTQENDSQQEPAAQQPSSNGGNGYYDYGNGDNNGSSGNSGGSGNDFYYNFPWSYFFGR